MDAARRTLEALGQEAHTLQAEQNNDRRIVALQAQLTSLAEAEVQLQRGMVGLEGQRRSVVLHVQVGPAWKKKGMSHEKSCLLF